MKGYLDTTSAVLKDLADQHPGRYVAFSPVGPIYVSAVKTDLDSAMVQLVLPSGERAAVPARDLYVLPVEVLELVTGAQVLERQHASQHAVENLKEAFHEGAEDEPEPPTYTPGGYR